MYYDMQLTDFVEINNNLQNERRRPLWQTSTHPSTYFKFRLCKKAHHLGGAT